MSCCRSSVWSDSNVAAISIFLFLHFVVNELYWSDFSVNTSLSTGNNRGDGIFMLSGGGRLRMISDKHSAAGQESRQPCSGTKATDYYRIGIDHHISHTR
mmetsp:Transcript_12856/g.24718  ORF Transcript_12856/g.24718 Transcript_12856/m.24718 type:complete len:100 (+) Transcript_12856:312-611(+)